MIKTSEQAVKLFARIFGDPRVVITLLDLWKLSLQQTEITVVVPIKRKDHNQTKREHG